MLVDVFDKEIERNRQSFAKCKELILRRAKKEL